MSRVAHVFSETTKTTAVKYWHWEDYIKIYVRDSTTILTVFLQFLLYRKLNHTS